MAEYFKTYNKSKVKKDNNTITTVSYDYGATVYGVTVYGAVVIPWKDNKIHQWKFKIIENTCLVTIGIDEASGSHLDKDFSEQKSTLNYGYCSIGKMYQSGSKSVYCDEYDSGDTISMCVSMANKTIKFCKNNKWFKTINIQNNKSWFNVKYKMAVCMHYRNTSICLLSYICDVNDNDDFKFDSVNNNINNDKELTMTLKISLQQRILDLEKQIKNQKNENDQYKKVNTANISLTNEKNELNCQISNVKKENETYKNELEKEKNVTELLRNQLQTQQKTVLRLKNKVHQLSQTNHKIKSLKIENNEYKQANLRQQTTILSLTKAKNQLKSENCKLMDDEKELKKEIKDLKLKNLDINRYLEWESEEILEWILSLENGRYCKYSVILKESLKDEGVKGIHLRKVDSSDIKGWGVKQFDDKKDLTKSIQQLVRQNIHFNEGVSTAFIAC